MIYVPWNNFCMIWVAYTCLMASLESFKGLPTIRTRIQAEEGPLTQKLKENKCVLKLSLGQIQCFKPMSFLFVLFLVETMASQTPHPQQWAKIY